MISILQGPLQHPRPSCLLVLPISFPASVKDGTSICDLDCAETKMAEKCLPYYNDIDGFRMAGAFYPQALRDTISYKPGPDDVFVVTFPKCGTTWLQYIVYLIYHKGEHPKSLKEFFMSCPFLEMAGIEAIPLMSRPGAMKTHLPFHLQPYSSEAKYMYVTRNPKDCCVSFYHHTAGNFAYRFENGTFDDYFEIFINGENDYGDYFDHVLSWYKHRNDPNVLFLTYEEMKKDISKVIRQVAGFLGEEYEMMLDEDPTLLETIKERSSVDFMRNEIKTLFKEMENPGIFADIMTPAMKHVFSQNMELKDDYSFVRKGIVGDWRNVFSSEQNRRINEKMEKKLAGTELLKFWKDNNYV